MASAAPKKAETMPWSIYDGGGQRKYLTRSETDHFLAVARTEAPDVYGFCWLMAATGCRISEALATTASNIDFEARHLVIESLKKRGKRVFRAIPLPSKLLNWLRDCIERGILGTDRLWPWSRMTGYRRITEVMQKAGISEGCATPKGLRHAFGVRAIQSGVPLNMVQRWLGHADMKTTAIYTSAMGPEERAIASRTWLEQDARYEERQPVTARARPKHYSPYARKGGGGHVTTALAPEIAAPDDSVGPKWKNFTPGSDAPCDLIQFWLFCNLLLRDKSYT